jgi:TolB-like protein
MITTLIKKIQTLRLIKQFHINAGKGSGSYSGIVVTVICLCSLLFLGGCFGRSKQPWIPSNEETGIYRDLLQATYIAGDNIVELLNHREFPDDAVILSATFVDINDLTKSSPFGRILSEHLSSRLAQYGYLMKELKLRQDSIFVKKGEGEFLLSRELSDISVENDAHSILAGTYAVSKYSVFVSVRVIRSRDNILIASYDFQLQLSRNVKALLENEDGIE